MKPGIPWSVKGIEPEAREAAKHAARRAGMTLGEWLNTVILDQSEDGVPTGVSVIAKEVDLEQDRPNNPSKALGEAPMSHPKHDRDSSLRLEDIAQQLSQLAQRERESATIQSFEPSRRQSEDREAIDRVLSRIDSNERKAVEAFTAVNERLSVLGRQIAMSQNAPSPVFEKPEDVPGFSALEAAIRNVVEHIEVSEKRTRDGLKGMQDRLSAMTERASHQANPDDLVRAAPAFAGLESRIAELANRLQHSENLIQSGLPDLVRKELNHLADRIESVRTSAERMAEVASESALGSARDELGEIETRILGVLKEAQATIGMQQVSTADLQRLRGDIGSINKRMDDVHQSAASERDVHALRVAVEQLSTRVAQGADMRPLADMDKRLGELAVRMEQNYQASRNLPQFGELERRIAELDHRLESAMQMQGDHEALAALQEQIAVVNDRVERTEEQISHLEVMERSVQQLFESLEQHQRLAGQTAEDAANRAVERMLAAQRTDEPSSELRALQEGLQAVRDSAAGADQRNQETLEAVHETLEQIVNKLAELETTAAGHQLAANMAHQATRQAANWRAGAPDAGEMAQEVAEAAATADPHFFDPSGAFQQPMEPSPTDSDVEADADRGSGQTSPAAPELQFQSQQQTQAGEFASTGPAPEANYGSSASTNGDDFIAAARRAAQAAASRPSVLHPEVKPDIKPGANSKFSLSLPFMKRKTANKPITYVGGKPVAPAPAKSSSDSKRKKLVLAGIVLLAAVSAFAFNMLAKPAKQHKQSTAIEAPLSAAPMAGSSIQSAEQPAKAEMMPSDSVAGSDNRSVDTDSERADMVVTGSLPAKKTEATLESIVAEPGTMASASPKSLPAEIGTSALREAAQQGDAKAQFIVASRYLDGQNVAQDLPQAAVWYQQAASRGLAPAQYRLATLFERGKGVPQDVATALLWYERAAAGGNVKAMHNAAVIAAGNQAGTPNYDKAFKWFRAAADYGLFDSQFNLAVLYERGLGTKVDKSEAYFWYSLAAKQGDQDATKRAENLAKSMTAAEVIAAKARIGAWAPAPSVDDANVVAVTDPKWNDVAASKPTEAKVVDALSDENTVVEAQQLLTGLGYNIGTADGKMGSRTANAIRLFQLQSGLKVTGEVTPDLIEAMRAKSS